MEAETEGVRIQVKEIAQATFPKLRDWASTNEKDRKKELPKFARYVSKVIQTVPMFRKKGITKGLTWILFKRNDLEKYMKLQHFLDDKEEEPK
ncbi:hypothetical protein K8R33_00485 [archaeon]|nr:hypothetical protein [archaeon]